MCETCEKSRADARAVLAGIVQAMQAVEQARAALSKGAEGLKAIARGEEGVTTRRVAFDGLRGHCLMMAATAGGLRMLEEELEAGTRSWREALGRIGGRCGGC